MTDFRVLYLVPDLTGLRGGIARYCRMVTLALTHESIPLTAVALNDRSKMARTNVPPGLDYRPCRGHRVLFVLSSFLALLRRPRLIILGHPNFSVLGLLLARLSGAHLIVFMYGIDVWTPLPPLRRWALRRAHGWIAISHFTAQRAAAANGLPLDRIHILYNCLDPALDVDWESEPEQYSLLSVSRITTSEPSKGHGYVIDALPTILARFPDSVYHIVGDGDGRPALEELVRRRGLADRVRFHGLVSEEELIRRYQACEVFVLPSRSEGFGFVFLEAMAYGKPVVAGREDAAVEVIQQGQTGFLVDPQNSQEIAEAVVRVFDDTQLCREMGERGKRLVRSSFTFDRFRSTLTEYLWEYMPGERQRHGNEDEAVNGRVGMRILHVIPSISPVRGGPSNAIRAMAGGLSRAGLDVTIATTDDDGPQARIPMPPGGMVETSGYTIRYFPRQTRFYAFSWPLTAWLARSVRDFDVVHVHTLFSYATLPAAVLAARAGVPYVIRPLGTLNRWGRANRRPRLKNLSYRVLESRILRHASAIHFTSPHEVDEASDLGLSNMVLLPLGFDLTPFASLPPATSLYYRFPSLQGRPVVLFLSRLDRIKGIELLLGAMVRVREAVPHAVLFIAGGGDPEYERELHEAAARLHLDDCVIWAGFLRDDDKLAAFAAATIFVLPSVSENFGVAPVEALAAGLPVIVTPGVGIADDIARHEAGLVVSRDVPSIASAIVRLLLDGSLRADLGMRARSLAREQYAAETMVERLLSLYERLQRPQDVQVVEMQP